MTYLERYQHAKLALSAEFQATDTILHIHAGLAIFMAARLTFGRYRTPLLAWLVVALVEAANEIVDRVSYGSWRSANTTSDVLQTMFWPTMLTLVRLLDRRRRKR